MDDCVNPSSPHRLSYELQRQLTTAAAGLATLVTGRDDTGVQVIWTSGGTEANNLAVLGFAGARSGPLRIVSTRTEHASVLAPLEQLQGQGAKLQLADVHGSGHLDLDHLAACLDGGADLVSICHVQNETGAIQDLTAVRELIDRHAPGACLQVDAMQSFGKSDINWQAARIDMLSLSGHKIHGPGGQGALIVRDGVELRPILFGGGQQDNLRSGSLDGVGIRLLCLAASQIIATRPQAQARVADLNKRLRSGLEELTAAVRFISSEDGSPYILSFTLPGYQGAVLARMLTERGIHIGTGSACAAESKTPSRVLTAMGLTSDEAYGALRVSFCPENSETDVDDLLDAL
ncbi:MAG TPA: hypothetical protein DIT01_06465, partial [Lentisphaeria bacterium]|nr:hypothetical protein [Lentisphaeria bacterium]